jgi:hypothetical protein
MNNAMRGFLLLIAVITVGFAACNYTDGECWYFGEGSENAGAGVGPGGGVSIPTGPGVGGYGEGPPKQPQDASNPPPVCNIASDNPCDEKCDAEDDARDIECEKIQDKAQRKACEDSSYEKYKSCVQECEKSTSKSPCLKKWIRCTNEAPYYECARPGSGDEGTKCRDCYRACESGNPTSPECKKCLF